MGRHNNQDRIVAPEMDTRLRQIAEACVRSGFPPALCDLIAEGAVHRLRRRCWETLTDSVGTGDDVERMVGWQGPPRVLSKALEAAGYLKDVKGVYLAVDAVAEAPEYIKARWRRHSKPAYDAAAARATNPNVIHPRPVEEVATELEEDAMPEDTLFGVVPDVPKVTTRVDSAHSKFSRRWEERYTAVYGRGYTWGRKSDERFIKWIIDKCDSLTECFAVIDAYLADRSAFYQGHEIRKLANDLTRFRRGGGSAVGRNPGKSQADTGSVIGRD